MAIFMVGYDLHEGEDYKDLEDAIKAYGAWWHHLDSTWLIKTENTARQIKNNLKQHLKAGDELLVMRYGKTESGDGANASWFGFNESGKNWLKNNL